MTYAIVVGAGPAGSAAAIGLAHAGARILLLERARETGDALCGGFLSWQTLERLAALGIDRHALGGQSVRRVRLFAGKRSSETGLPGTAMGVSRRRLDSALQAAIGTALETKWRAILSGNAPPATDLSRNALAADILAESGLDVGQVFITVDPDRDTPETIGPFAEALHPDLVALTGTAAEIVS